MPPTSRKRRKLSRATAIDKPNNDKDFQTIMHYMPHDIWFEILLWFSATCLYNIMSRVSNTWATIIFSPCFVDTHLRRSRSGILVQRFRCDVDRYLEVIDGNVQVTYLNVKSWFPGALYSSYQGICLFYRDDTKADYVMNFVTMQLDQIFRPVAVPEIRSSYTAVHNFSVIRDRRSGELKLVFAFQQYCGEECSWYVQKLGIENSWKMISGTHTFATIHFPGLSIGGFVLYQVSNSIVVVDVSDETIHMICCCPEIEHSQVTYLQMGNDLSCVSRKSDRIFVHIMKDFHAGKWSLYHILDYGFIPGKPLEFLHFLGWINNSEELLVRMCTFTDCSELGSCYMGPYLSLFEGGCCKSDFRYRYDAKGKWIYSTYNLKTKRLTCLNEYICAEDRVRVHTNSLISWKPLQA